jgi:hypothetical protein
MTDTHIDKFIAQFSQSTSDETYTDLSLIGDNSVNSYSTDTPYAALKKGEITDEEAIKIIRKASEFTTITPELEGIYRAKVGQGLSYIDACNAVLNELADFVKK